MLLGAGADNTRLFSSVGIVVTVTVEGCVIEGFDLWADDSAFGSIPGRVTMVVCLGSSPRIFP